MDEHYIPSLLAYQEVGLELEVISFSHIPYACPSTATAHSLSPSSPFASMYVTLCHFQCMTPHCSWSAAVEKPNNALRWSTQPSLRMIGCPVCRQVGHRA